MRLRGIEVEVVPAGPAETSPLDEAAARQEYRRVLGGAERTGSPEVAVAAIGIGTGGLSVVASGKIMAQEVIRFARERPKRVRRVLLCRGDPSDFPEFRSAVEGYLTHFLDELSWGPMSTVDAIIEVAGGVVVVVRSNPPFGLALPGGFVDYGESLEEAVRREAMEETGLELLDLAQLHTYSEPGRDPRFHTISTVFTARSDGTPRAGDDAAALRVVDPRDLPRLQFAFDHGRILADWLAARRRASPGAG